MRKKRSGRRYGRDTKLNQSIIDKASALLQKGVFECTVFNLLGIPSSTWYMWKERGRQDREQGVQSIYVEFLEAIEKSEAYAEVKSIEDVKAAGEAGDWRASAWFLERRFQDRWGHKIGMDISADVNIEYLIVEAKEAVKFIKEGEGEQ